MEDTIQRIIGIIIGLAAAALILYFVTAGLR